MPNLKFMIKVLQINVIVNNGSTGRIVEQLGQTFIENKWSSYVASGRKFKSSVSHLIKVGSICDIAVHGLFTRLFDKHGLASKHATKKLIEQINIIKPDIIHLHNLHGYYLNIVELFNYLSKSNIPIVWTFHDCWPMTGHCAHFDHIGCNKWKTECSKCPQKKEYPASFGLDRSSKNFKLKKELFTSSKRLTIVTVSDWLENLVKDSFFKEFPIQVIQNGINIDVFKPQENNFLKLKYKIDRKIIILGVSSIWNDKKGFGTFLELGSRLDENYQIILVGLNKFQIRNLPSNIIGILKTENPEELANFYASADIYFNPSVEETFGLTTVEALASGTPVIVYNCTANPELVSADTGFIVEKGNMKEVLNAINIIINKGKSSYIEACRARAINLYDKNIKNLEYLNLYKSLLNKQVN